MSTGMAVQIFIELSHISESRFLLALYTEEENMQTFVMI